MSARCVIPVEPASGHGETVVIDVQQEGSHALDLRLVGCEGESPFVASIKQRNIGKLKHKFKGSDDEWATVLSHFLLQKHPEHASILDRVRMVYTLKDNNLELSIRQDVQGIKVTLGEIILPRDDEFEFNPFDWAQASARAHARTLQEMADLNSRARSEQDTITKLNAQLEDFVKTKNEAETAMLQQFMELLNEKKRKIRDQSRILAGTNEDKGTASAVQSARTGTKTRKAGASRASKRKASAQAAEPVLAGDSDSDQMEVDQAKTEEQDEEEALEPGTPDRSDDETESEDEDDAIVPKARDRVSQPARASPGANSTDEEVESKGVPPPRSLPFGRPATRSKGSEQKPLPSAEDDDETEDDEL